jgi:anti-sigma factor RsiW
MDHVADRLQALVSGALSPAERERAEAHLASCPECREERDLLAAARALLPALPEIEPRPGFAARVARGARDPRPSPFAQWLRWTMGGVAVATAAAVAVAVLPGPVPPRRDDVRVAQRLELFEDLAVLQNVQALEDMEVVSVLHTLEAHP